jgi:hypothetical protein
MQATQPSCNPASKFDHFLDATRIVNLCVERLFTVD